MATMIQFPNRHTPKRNDLDIATGIVTNLEETQESVTLATVTFTLISRASHTGITVQHARHPLEHLFPEPEEGQGARVWGYLDPRTATMELEEWEDHPDGTDTLSTLVCGGRDFSRMQAVRKALDRMGPDHVIHGGARGADTLAARYAGETRTSCYAYPVAWRDRRGNYVPNAAFNRNQKMLDEGQPDLVVAFPGGGGTRDMVRRARKRGTPVHIMDHQGNRRPGKAQVVPA